MESDKDIRGKTPITTHILRITVSIFMLTLAYVFATSTLSLINYLKQSETIGQQLLVLNGRTNKALQKPVSLISEVIYGVAFKSLGRAEIISELNADSLVSTSLKNIRQDSEQLAVLMEIILKNDTDFLNYNNNIMKAKMSEADAALGSIRTQLRIYYGENGTYPYSRRRAQVVGASWNDIQKGELTGKYFNDSSFTYYGPDGDTFIITCDAGNVLESDRTLNQSGTLSGGIR